MDAAPNEEQRWKSHRKPHIDETGAIDTSTNAIL
jgi:hypothetical protein